MTKKERIEQLERTIRGHGEHIVTLESRIQQLMKAAGFEEVWVPGVSSRWEIRKKKEQPEA